MMMMIVILITVIINHAHLVISAPEQHIHHVISRKMRRQQVALVEEAAAEDIELSGQVIEVLAVVLEVSSLKLTQGIVNLRKKIKPNYRVPLPSVLIELYFMFTLVVNLYLKAISQGVNRKGNRNQNSEGEGISNF